MIDNQLVQRPKVKVTARFSGRERPIDLRPSVRCHSGGGMHTFWRCGVEAHLFSLTTFNYHKIRKRNRTWNKNTAATVTDDPSYPGTCCRISFGRAQAQWSSVWSLASSWSVQVMFYAVFFSWVDRRACTHNCQ